MDVIVQRPAALDVHKERLTTRVRVPGPVRTRAEEVREFKTTVGGLLVLHDWLMAHASRRSRWRPRACAGARREAPCCIPGAAAMNSKEGSWVRWLTRSRKARGTIACLQDDRVQV